MATTGQTINDRLNAVRYALVGQGLARTVCKATTEEVLGPKKKHIDYLIACANEPNVSIPQLANLLIDRTQHTSWAVVFKSLISIHHLMSYGNERFTQYLATSNHSFELADFMDRTTPQGYNMSTFVRRYAKYINDKSISYRTLAIDLCKIRSGNDNALRVMNMDNLSKTLPIVQQQLDSLLDFAASSKDLNNSVIMSAFRLLYKDLVKLYVAYQEAIINLLERYFKLSRKKTREALEMYKKYLVKMDKVAEFLQVVDGVGLDKSEMPDLTKSPASILNVLEQHLAQLEAKKRGATTPISPDAQGEDDDDDADINKENQGKSTAPQQQARDVKTTGESGEEKIQQQQNLGKISKEEPSPAANKDASSKTAQKPARPSPKSSPLVSPSDSKSPPTSSAKPASSASSTIQAAEKKGPPERPTKPPSRPPPPSAAQAPPASPPKPSGGPSSGGSSAPQSTSATSAKVASHAPPPPHPPPPQPHHHPQPPPHPPAPHAPPHHPAPSTSPARPASSQTTGADLNSTTTSDSTGINSHSNNNSSNCDNNLESLPAERPTCSASMVATADDSTVGLQAANHEDAAAIGNEVETNHINSVNQEIVQEASIEVVPVAEIEEELEMPPPPPPIDDLDDSIPEPPPPVEVEEVQAADGERDQQGLVEGDHQPALNGQPTNGTE